MSAREGQLGNLTQRGHLLRAGQVASVYGTKAPGYLNRRPTSHQAYRHTRLEGPCEPSQGPSTVMISTRLAAPLGYSFITVEAQWYAARWSLGVIGLIMDGVRPARVADQIIDDLRKRERNGLIKLPKRPALQPGDQVRILQGPFAGQLGLYAGMRRHGAFLVLLQLLELATGRIEATGGRSRFLGAS